MQLSQLRSSAKRRTKTVASSSVLRRSKALSSSYNPRKLQPEDIKMVRAYLIKKGDRALDKAVVGVDRLLSSVSDDVIEDIQADAARWPALGFGKVATDTPGFAMAVKVALKLELAARLNPNLKT